MRLLCQNIGSRANREDRETGKFWQSRYKAVRILDDETLLACAAYVDLNPIRAALAETLEECNHTSVQRRIQSLSDPLSARNPNVHNNSEAAADLNPKSRDASLSPVMIDERNDPIGPHPSFNGKRCSDKGFLAMSTLEYLQVLDWAARNEIAGKRGFTPPKTPPVLQRLGIDSDAFSSTVQQFGKLFCHVAGKPKSVSDARSLHTRRRFYQRHPIPQLTPA
jgi:hypothetical protein